eukprot:scaffold45460_cov67-Phaeocystis_antarctica.AAC.6
MGWYAAIELESRDREQLLPVPRRTHLGGHTQGSRRPLTAPQRGSRAALWVPAGNSSALELRGPPLCARARAPQALGGQPCRSAAAGPTRVTMRLPPAHMPWVRESAPVAAAVPKARPPPPHCLAARSHTPRSRRSAPRHGGRACAAAAEGAVGSERTGRAAAAAGARSHGMRSYRTEARARRVARSRRWALARPRPLARQRGSDPQASPSAPPQSRWKRWLAGPGGWGHPMGRAAWLRWLRRWRNVLQGKAAAAVASTRARARRTKRHTPRRRRGCCSTTATRVATPPARGGKGWWRVCGPPLLALHHQIRPRALTPPAVTLAAPQLAARYTQQAWRVASLTEHLPWRLSGAVRRPMAHARWQVLARDEGDSVRRCVVQREAQRHIGVRRVELQHGELAASQRAGD